MARQFAEVLRDLASGDVYSELTAGLIDVVQGVQETGKVGSLELKLKIKPSGDGQTVTVFESIKLGKPEKTRPATIFFATADGGLMRGDPRQRDLPLREVAKKEGAA